MTPRSSPRSTLGSARKIEWSRRPGRLPLPRRVDYFSSLPTEIHLQIASYIHDNHSSSLINLSKVSKKLRSICITTGLFRQVCLTPRRVSDVLFKFNGFLYRNRDIAATVEILAIDGRLFLGTSLHPSPLSNVLQRLPELRTLRVFGVWGSVLVNRGPLSTEDRRLYRTLTSGKYLRKLKRIELEDMAITRIFRDIVVVIPGYDTLSLSECWCPSSRSLLHIPGKVSKLDLHNTCLTYAPSGICQWIKGSHMGRTVTYLAIHNEHFLRQWIQPTSLSWKTVFPKLHTLYCEQSASSTWLEPPGFPPVPPIIILNFVWRTGSDNPSPAVVVHPS